MSRPRRPRRADLAHGVEHEPHLRPRSVGPDPREDDAHRLEDEPARASEVDRERMGSCEPVSDEPSLAWSSFDRSANPGFAATYAIERARTGPGKRLAIAVGLVLAAGPWAVIGALLEGLVSLGRPAFWAVVLFGPVVEEVLKIAAAAWFVERKPWLLSGVTTVILVGAASGLGFGAIENLLYLQVYFPDAGRELARWRWSVTMPMHAVASTIAAIGLARVWREIDRAGKPADFTRGSAWLVAAIVLHGGYNLFAVLESILASFD